MKYYRFLLTGLILISGLFSNSKEYVLTQTKIDNPISYVQYNPDDYPDRTRQGGDTYDDATEIESLPFSITGTTDGYTDDYDETCPYAGSTAPDVVYSFSPEYDIIFDDEVINVIRHVQYGES